MKINDNYLKEQLKHVYWLNGSPCAGKTTMTKKFVNDLGFQTLADDIIKYRPYSCPIEHNALQYPNADLDWNEWFNKPVDEYCKWLHDLPKEMMEFFIIDLLKLPNDKPIIIDLGIMPEYILSFIPKERMICLFTSNEEIERLYYFRDDHKMILDCIRANTDDPENTIKHCNKSLIKFAEEVKNACIKNNIKTLERTPDLSVDEQFKLVREHFGL